MADSVRKIYMMYGTAICRPDCHTKIVADEKKKSLLWGNVKYSAKVIASLLRRCLR